MAEWDANNAWAQPQTGEAAQWGDTGAQWGESASQSWGNANWETPEENKQQTQQSLTQDSSAVPPSNLPQLQLQPVEALHSAQQPSAPSAPSTIFLANATIPQANTIQTSVTLPKSELFAPSTGSQSQHQQLKIDVNEPHAEQSDAALPLPLPHESPQLPQTAKVESRPATLDFWDEPMQISPQLLDQQAPPQAPATATAVTTAAKQISDDFLDFTSSKQPAATVVQQTVKEPREPASGSQKQLSQAQSHSRTQSDHSAMSSQLSVQSAATTQQLAKTSLKARPKAAAESAADAQSKALSKAEQRRLEKAQKENAKKKEEMEKTMLQQTALKATSQKPANLPPKQPAQRPSMQAEPKADEKPAQLLETQPQRDDRQPGAKADNKQLEALIRENERLRTELRCFAFDGVQVFEDSAVQQLQERFLQWRAGNSENDALKTANKALSEKVAELERRDYESSQNSILYYQQQASQLQKEVLDKEEEKMRAVEQNNVALRKKNQQIQELIGEVARLRLELAKR